MDCMNNDILLNMYSFSLHRTVHKISVSAVICWLLFDMFMCAFLFLYVKYFEPCFGATKRIYINVLYYSSSTNYDEFLKEVKLFCQLMEFLGDTNELAAADVLVFVREAVQRFDNLRPLVISRLLDVFPSIKAMK